MEKEKRATAEWNPRRKGKLAIQSGGLTRGEGREHPGGGVPEDPSSHASPPGHTAFRACACVCARSPPAKEAVTDPPPSRPRRQASGGEVRGAQCAARPGKRPVRADFTRQECAPPPPPPHGGRPRILSARRPRNARGSAANSPNTVGAAGPCPTPSSAPRRRPRRSPGPSPRPERRPEAPSVGEPPGPRGSGARRTSAPQGGGGAGRRASRPIPRRQKAEEERRTALHHRCGTFSARARAAVERLRAAAFPNSPQ